MRSMEHCLIVARPLADPLSCYHAASWASLALHALCAEVRRKEVGLSRRPTLKEALWAMLNSAPKTPAMTEMTTMKGSCSNHSVLESSATPLNDSTPYFHLQCQLDSAVVKRIHSSHQHFHLIKTKPTRRTIELYHKPFGSLTWGAAGQG